MDFCSLSSAAVHTHIVHALALVAGVWCLAPGHAIKGTVGSQRGTEQLRSAYVATAHGGRHGTSHLQTPWYASGATRYPDAGSRPGPGGAQYRDAARLLSATRGQGAAARNGPPL